MLKINEFDSKETERAAIVSELSGYLVDTYAFRANFIIPDQRLNSGHK